MTTPHATLSKITLQLARNKEFPEGSPAHGYVFTAPLDAEGRLNPAAWRDHRAACTVRRYWGSEPPVHGWLAHRSGGENGATWGFDYDAATHEDDEAGFRLDSHRFKPGEYVSITDPAGKSHTFKVAAITPG
jgi:hypothetical protein